MNFWPFRMKSSVRTRVSKPAESALVALWGERPLALRISDEIGRLGFDGAQDIVCPFAEKLYQKTLVRAPMYSGDTKVLDSSMFFSKSNLATTRDEAFIAYRCYYVLSPSEDAAEAAMWTIFNRLTDILPDDYPEPIQLDDHDMLLAKKAALREELARDESTIRAVRDVLQGSRK